jgi:chaperonin GroES
MYKPEGAKVLVRPEQVEKVTAGGIVLPDTSRDSEQTRVTRGEIVAIGPSADIEFESGAAKVGDKIIFAKYGGFSLDDDKYRFVNDEDIVALIVEET